MESVVSCRIQIYLCILACVFSREFTRGQLRNFFQLSFPEFDVNSFKGFQSDQIQRNSRKIFTAHYACRNVDLNLTLATQRYNIVVTLFRIPEILFQHLNAKNSRCESFRVNINLTDSFLKIINSLIINRILRGRLDLEEGRFLFLSLARQFALLARPESRTLHALCLH